MFKNKNIKKFISIVCSILTLNSVTSLSQTKVDALKFKTEKDDYDCPSTTVTLDKPFYYIAVYDKQLSTTYPPDPRLTDPLRECRRNWKKVGLKHCLGVDELNGQQTLTEEETDISSYRQKLKEVFSKADDYDEIALALAVGTADNLQQFPRLPWMLVLTPTHNHLETKSMMRKLTSQQQMFLPKVQKDDDAYIPCIEVPKFEMDATKLQAVALADGQQDVTILSTEEWLKKWRPQAAIMTVGRLKEWIRNNNQDLARQLGIQEDPATQHTSRAKKSENSPIDKSIGKQSIDELENKSTKVQPIEFKEKNVSTFNKGNQDELTIEEKETTTTKTQNPTGNCQQKLYTTSSELNSCKKPITRNILCNTNKLIKKHPKTSVGLAATILALVGTIIYKIQKLFTRKSQKSQAKNQVTQKYNQHVKNKI